MEAGQLEAGLLGTQTSRSKCLKPFKDCLTCPFRKAGEGTTGILSCSVQRMAWGKRYRWLFFSLARESTVPGPGACRQGISSPLSGLPYLKSSLSAFFSQQLLLVPSSNSNPFLFLLSRAMILNLGSIIRTPGGLCYNSDRQPYFPNFWCSWPGYDSWYGTFWMVSWWFLNLMLGETILIRWCASVAQISAISVVYSSEDHFCSFFFFSYCCLYDQSTALVNSCSHSPRAMTSGSVGGVLRVSTLNCVLPGLAWVYNFGPWMSSIFTFCICKVRLPNLIPHDACQRGCFVVLMRV